jgi:hypothetical protein
MLEERVAEPTNNTGFCVRPLTYSTEGIYNNGNKCTEHFEETSAAICDWDDFNECNGTNAQGSSSENSGRSFAMHVCFPGNLEQIGVGHSMLHMRGSGGGNDCCNKCLPGPVCLADTCL